MSESEKWRIVGVHPDPTAADGIIVAIRADGTLTIGLAMRSFSEGRTGARPVRWAPLHLPTEDLPAPLPPTVMVELPRQRVVEWAANAATHALADACRKALEAET